MDFRRSAPLCGTSFLWDFFPKNLYALNLDRRRPNILTQNVLQTVEDKIITRIIMFRISTDELPPKYSFQEFLAVMLNVLHNWRGRQDHRRCSLILSFIHSLSLSLCGRCVLCVDVVFVDVCERGVVWCGVVSSV